MDSSCVIQEKFFWKFNCATFGKFAKVRQSVVTNSSGWNVINDITNTTTSVRSQFAHNISGGIKIKDNLMFPPEAITNTKFRFHHWSHLQQLSEFINPFVLPTLGFWFVILLVRLPQTQEERMDEQILFIEHYLKYTVSTIWVRCILTLSLSHVIMLEGQQF